ncbi:protein kinase domain-containing protein [Saccharibacillus endophyticus]|uniref:Protein kinase domain-containing protein n=1 Tax=Saccharibacillus endophyticus TaxID=2060666 RepID=A0ABQ2A4P5_9BACL|nr:protein kinase [Saccharibacillus endophyticus]GGH84751.1 hypothetical protein GCM10007362_40550 [Saccharibacillus endophyticus]
MNKTEKYSPYKVIDKNFAAGGNAKVLLVKNEKGEKYALKSMKMNSAEDVRKIKRFLNEIKIVEKYQYKIKGIVPIVFKFIPEKINGDFEYTKDLKGVEVWYVMELAEPVSERLSDCDDLKEIIDCVISLSETLEELHRNKIVHRDIKPSNIYYYKSEWAFGDFGLVAYPDFENDALTKINERLGNHATIAPEMRRAGQVEDARPADVWSLAKTLWMLLTKNSDLCFEGTYSRSDKEISIAKYWKEWPISSLHDILEISTSYEPKSRIDITEFSTLLKEYKEMIMHKGRILSYEELKLRESKSKDRIYFHNSANSIISRDEVIREHYSQVCQEAYFIKQDQAEEATILKYIKKELEFFYTKKYLISPILRHFRNENLPSIRIYVEYTDFMYKFVTALVCSEKMISSFNTPLLLENYYDSKGEVDYKIIDKFIQIIDLNSMNSV